MNEEHIIYDDIRIFTDAYIHEIDGNNLYHFINKEDIIVFKHSECGGYIQTYKDKVKCKRCDKVYNISPKKLVFIVKMTLFSLEK